MASSSRRKQAPIRDLNDALAQVEESERRVFGLGVEAVKAADGDLFAYDLVVVSASTRAILISKGYRALMQDRNYVAAYPMVRLALDCCLCLCAGHLVGDLHTFAMHVLDGGRVTDYKDKDGKLLSDTRLRRVLHEMHPEHDVNTMYKRCSAWIHMSTNHILTTASVSQDTDGQRNIGVQLGYVKELPDEKHIETTLSLAMVNAMLCQLIVEWHNTKMVGKAESNKAFQGKLYAIKMPVLTKYVRPEDA